MGEQGMVGEQEVQDANQLKLLSVFHYLVGGGIALVGCLPIIHLLLGVFLVALGASGAKDAPPSVLGWFVVALALGAMALAWTFAGVTVLAGRSLAQRRRYTLCLVVAGLLTITCVPLGTILGVFTIVILMRPTVKRVFGVVA